MPTQISFSNVRFCYGENQRFPTINLSINKGSLVSVIGPNGVGKTTLLKLIANILPAHYGKVKIRGLVGFLQQRNFFDIHFPISVFDIVSMGLYSRYRWINTLDKQAKRRVTAAIEKVGLLDMAHQNVGCLSGGQFQRAIFARLIVQNPEILLLDEPFNAVDCSTLKILIDQIQSWHESGKTILSVVHDTMLVRKHFKECIVMTKDVVKHVSMDIVTNEFLAQIFFCGEHAGTHDVV